MNWIIYPVLNPDGYENTWVENRYWRKNMNPNNGHDCKGVDLNRNYDAEWMNGGTSQNECDVTYGGTGPFSEPETRAHRDHQNPLPNKLAYLTYHAFSEFIIYPYSSSYEAEAANKDELNDLAGEMQSKIEAIHGKKYGYGEGAPSFYVASGGSDDWSHMNNVDIVFTVELRDRGTYGFAMPESEIIKTCQENIAGMEAVYDHVRPSGTCKCDKPAYQSDDNQFTCDGVVVTDTPPTASTTAVTTEPSNCCQKIVVGSVLGEIYGNYIQQSELYNALPFYKSENGEYILSFHADWSNWTITKGPYFAQDGNAMEYLYGYNSIGGAVCLSKTFTGSFYYHNGESWAMVSSANFYCADTNVTPPSSDLIPHGVNCPHNHFTGADKIVNGAEANPNSWPWIARMMVFNTYAICSGSIITNNWILTAAHCCVPVTVSLYFSSIHK